MGLYEIMENLLGVTSTSVNSTILAIAGCVILSLFFIIVDLIYRLFSSLWR